MMNEPVNRVKQDIDQWMRYEESLKNLDAKSIPTKKLLREKLKYLDTVAGKYIGTQNPEERLALIYVNEERDRLSENRSFWSIILFFINGEETVLRNTEKQFVAATERNIGELKDRLLRLGLENGIAGMQEQIKKGVPTFKIPISFYVSETERMDYALSFSKNITGEYELDSYQATLKNEVSADSKAQHVKPVNGVFFSAAQAYHLLAGRSVLLQQETGLVGLANNQTGIWYKLDFTDRDPSGDYKVKEFHQNFGYDLVQRLNQLTFRDDKEPLEFARIQKALENGEQAAIAVPVADGYKTVYIEANPQRHEFNFYNEHRVPIAKHVALSDKQSMDIPAEVNKAVGHSQQQGEQVQQSDRQVKVEGKDNRVIKLDDKKWQRFKGKKAKSLKH